MQFAFSEEQNLIRETARGFLDERGSSEQLRAAIESAEGYDTDAWREISQELGWTGIAIPERYGGAGLGMVELAILQHEHGRRIFPSPFFATTCLATPLILSAGSEEQKQDLLGRIAAGELRVAVAISDTRGTPGLNGVKLELRREADGFRLAGESSFVIHGAESDLLFLAARAPGSRGADGISIVVLEPGRAGLEIQRLTMLDLTRPMACLRCNNVRVSSSDLLGTEGSAGAALERALQLARIAIAAEAVGGAEYLLGTTIAYAHDRVQFGRPIGSFQVIKHRLADMMVLVEAAKSAAWYAACVADELEDELSEAAAIAKASCCEAFFDCAANAIQIHGGIGFTWEHDAHLYFKRARASSTLLGSPAWQREQLARVIGLGAEAEPSF